MRAALARLDPTDFWFLLATVSLARNMYHSGKHREALSTLANIPAQRFVELGPLNRLRVRWLEGNIYTELGDLNRAEQALDDKPAFVQHCGSEALRDALSDAAARLHVVEFPEAMWRIIDHQRVAGLAGLPRGTADAALIDAIVGDGRAMYWTSDRF